MRNSHTITVEKIDREIREYNSGPFPKRHTYVVVERFDGGIVKLCHSGNLVGNGFANLCMVAKQYASAYGAQYVSQ